MAIFDYPIINGHIYQWSSVEVRIDGVTFWGVKELRYSHKRDLGLMRGTTPFKLGRTRGVYTAEGNITLYEHEWLDLVLLLGGDGYMEKVFAIVASRSELSSPLDATADILHGCTITSIERGGAEGADPLEVKANLDIMMIEESGYVPMKDM